MLPPNSEDRPFRHYTLKHRITAWVSTNLFDGITYTVRRGLLRGMRRRGGLGWIPLPDTMTAEQAFWQRCDLQDCVVFDVGAFHGLLTMFFARRARHVVSFEPNTKNHERLLENLRLNHLQNATVCKVGIGGRRGARTMVNSPLMPGGATLDKSISDSLLKSGIAITSETIDVITIDEAIVQYGLPDPDLLKIDIEGLEIEALRGAKRTLERLHPGMFLEIHGETMREKRQNVEEIVAFLWDLGYRRMEHIESASLVSPENASTIAAQGHLFCSPASVAEPPKPQPARQH